MSDQVQIPEFVVLKVGALTLQLAAAEERIRELEQLCAEHTQRGKEGGHS